MIKLSLSGRLFEAHGGYRLEREAFLDFAKQTGYDGVELRYPQMRVETPADEVQQVREQLAARDLTWVFGTVEGIADEETYARSINTMKQHIAGGALFTRFTIFKPEHIEIAQRFADEAAALDHTLLMQLHSNTLPDNVPHVIDTFNKIDRPNIKLAYEASHLVFDGDDNYVQAIDTLREYIAAVSIQNYKVASDADPDEPRININDTAFVRAMPGDSEALDFAAIFDGLKKIGFDGYATVMCDCLPDRDANKLAKDWYSLLSPLC